MATLITYHLYLGYDQKYQISNLNLTVPGGQITALVGPSGSGKSTILKGLARVLKPVRGRVALVGDEVRDVTPTDVAYLPQNPKVPESSTVAELVASARLAQRGAEAVLTLKDREAIARAIELMGLFPLIHRPMGTLCGGQRQRACMAAALARGAEILLLDEPTTCLDPAHQMELLALLERVNREEGKTIVLAAHDLNHAALIAHHMVVVKSGQVVAEGAPASVMTPGLLSRVFRINAAVVTEPRSGRPVFVPLGLTGNG